MPAPSSKYRKFSGLVASQQFHASDQAKIVIKRKGTHIWLLLISLKLTFSRLKVRDEINPDLQA